MTGSWIWLCLSCFRGPGDWRRERNRLLAPDRLADGPGWCGSISGHSKSSSSPGASLQHLVAQGRLSMRLAMRAVCSLGRRARFSTFPGCTSGRVDAKQLSGEHVLRRVQSSAQKGSRDRCAGTRGGCRAHRSLLGRRGGPHKDGSGYTERDVATVVRWPTWMIDQSRFPGGLSRCTGRERNARSAFSVHRAVSCACNGRCLCGESGLS